MEQKEKYITPKTEIIQFEQEDIITTSGNGGIELPDHIWGQYDDKTFIYLFGQRKLTLLTV